MEEETKKESSNTSFSMDTVLEGEDSQLYNVHQAIGKGKFAVVYKGERISDQEIGLCVIRIGVC